MSRLDELIQELCPDGVEHKELQEILKIKNGSDYKAYGEGDIPVYGSALIQWSMLKRRWTSMLNHLI